MSIPNDLIVTIVNRGEAARVVQASLKAGAEGATILHGRGSGIHEQAKLFGIPIEPEKDVVLTLLPEDRTNVVLEAICQAVDLREPGRGIAFVLPVKSVAGICHLPPGS